MLKHKSMMVTIAGVPGATSGNPFKLENYQLDNFSVENADFL
jgi:hypothetical protein